MLDEERRAPVGGVDYPRTLQDFDELYSRVGVGGGLTRQGAAAAIRSMNRKRTVLGKVAVLMESGEAELVEGIVEVLYRKVVVDGG